MSHTRVFRFTVVVLAGVLVGLAGSPTIGAAQTVVTGQAKAVQATVLGMTTALADTGTLGGTADAREASQVSGSVPFLLTGEVLHAVTIGWPNQVASEALIGKLAMTVAGTGVSADFVMARALAPLGGAGTGLTNVDGLSINDVSISPSGVPNETIPIAGGRVVINEQQSSSAGTVVNALHIIIDGAADVVIASAKAGMTSAGPTSFLPTGQPLF